MKIPNIFIPENKSLDRKLEYLGSGKPSRVKRIKDIWSLSYIPEKIGGYDLRTEFKIINQERWRWNFGEKIPKYITQAGEMTYIAPKSPVFATIYVLEFKNGTKLRLDRKTCLSEYFEKNDAIRIKLLKRDDYVVAIKTNHTDKQSADVFGNWYMNNFGMELL